VLASFVPGILLLALTTAAPGLLLAQAFASQLPLHLRVLTGFAVGLLVVPTLAFGAAMLAGTNLNPSFLALVAAAVSLPAGLVIARRRLAAARHG
jgi:hypothetical protein